MSQSYVIRVSASVKETVNAKDKRTKSLVLTEIVPADEQREILGALLREQGWEEDEESGVFRKTTGAVTETIDLENMTHEASVELERSLERERTITVRGDLDFDNPDERRKKEEAALERSLAIGEDEKSDAKDDMQREIAEALDEGEEERTQALNELVQGVYSESLKRKANKLGTVTSIQESREGGDYELIIQITE